MNRTTKFRGQRLDNHEWIYGDLLYTRYIGGREEAVIVTNWDLEMNDTIAVEYCEVNPFTVGQFTGLHDKNGQEIYDGDLLRYPAKSEWEKHNYESYEVFWHDNDYCNNHIGWQLDRIHFHGSLCGASTLFTNFKPKYVSKMEVIGTIYDKEAPNGQTENP